MLVLKCLVLRPVQPLLVHVCHLGPSDSPACPPIPRESSACPPVPRESSAWVRKVDLLVQQVVAPDHRPQTAHMPDKWDLYAGTLRQRCSRLWHSCTLPCTKLCTVLLWGAFFTYKHKDTRPTYISPVWRAKTSCRWEVHLVPTSKYCDEER